MTRTQSSAAPPDPAPHRLTQEERLAYWRKNLSLTVGLLIVWFVVAYLLGIIFSQPLNAVKLVQARWASGLPSKARSTCLSS